MHDTAETVKGCDIYSRLAYHNSQADFSILPHPGPKPNISGSGGSHSLLCQLEFSLVLKYTN
jgi:hypothetical protein